MSLCPRPAPASASASARDDRGAAMVTALMLVMVVGTLSILVLGTLVSQVLPVSLTQKTTRTIFAAEAGTQVALGALRTTPPKTVNGLAYGNPARLPCTLSGSVGGSASTLMYSVSVEYFTADPSGLTKDERATSPTRLPCVAGGGVSTAPAFAVISSKGLAAGVPGLATTAGDRTLETQYAFQLTNENVPGGVFRTSDLLLCLTADHVEPGSPVRYGNQCNGRTEVNAWIHAEGSGLVLASTAAFNEPLCLQGPEVDGGEVRLANCAEAARQKFSYRNYFRYEQQADGETGGGCLWAGVRDPSVLAGRTVHVSVDACAREKDGSSKATRPYWSWNPEPAVGAGSASSPDSLQFINYAEFGRCLEVKNEYLDADKMGIGPCKQRFSEDGDIWLRWNQMWTTTRVASDTAAIRLEVSKPYLWSWERAPQHRCLTTPQIGASVYPTLDACTSEQRQHWTYVTKTSDYATSYLLVDTYGRCLGGGEAERTDESTLTGAEVAPCDGSLRQKWNAPPNITPSGQSNTHESTNPN